MNDGNLGKILVVDDEVELKNILVESLTTQGYDVIGYASGQEALEALGETAFDIILTDLMMPQLDGISLLRSSLEIDPHVICIVMTGHGTIQTAVDAMKVGAFDYVLKPFRMTTILPLLTRAMNTRRLRLENLQLRETVAIYELCQTIAFTLDQQTIISKLADAALQQTRADEVSILLPTSSGEELYVAAVRGESRQRLLGERIPLEESISGWVARQREPLILSGEVSDDRFRPLWPHPEIRSSISVPMQVANKLVGTININALDRRRPFTLGQMKALTILSSTAAAALESASLYAQVLKAEEKYRSIFDNAVEGIFQSTPEGRFITVNPAMARILAYDLPEELIQTVTDVSRQLYVNPEDRLKSQEIEVCNGVLQDFVFEARRKDGEKIWLSLNRRTMRDESGVELFREGTVQDVTERKRAEAALRESEERYRDLVENAHDIIYSHDLEGNYTSMNKAGEEITGYTLEEALKLKMSDTVAPECLPKVQQMMKRKLAGERVTAYDIEIIAKDGRRVPVEVNTKYVYQNGVAAGVQGIARDVTERKQLEDQLRQSQKMEAIGQLAGGVAHDFNNLLTAINGYSSLALQRINPENPIKSYLEEIKKAGDRAANLTRQLLAFGRKQILQPVPLNLNDIVSDMNKMLRRLIGEDIDLTASLNPKLKAIKADPGQIEQVLVNLVVNARDAMPSGGHLTIETMTVELDSEYTGKRLGVVPGRYVMLAVSDTGTGMNEETKARIFDPFFTTKEKGKGTGLGLSTVYGIVKQSGGNIWVYSEEGRGTTFKVYLPQLETAETVESLQVETEIMPGSETILLLEDEDTVRNLARQILEGAGYKVVEVSRGEEAIKRFAAEDGSIDLLLTDVVMPEMSGKEVADRVCELSPSLKVLFMSGYTDEAIVHHGVLDSNVQFIQKPFTPAALTTKVRQVLDLDEAMSGR
ncbi:MAG: hybrid sensor histidine kinase/response regulator [Acidobacteria bacterium]|nr:MAG: hybrid sensor histidine kinase/response regulator [Acidobacteriota bacterium]